MTTTVPPEHLTTAAGDPTAHAARAGDLSPLRRPWRPYTDDPLLTPAMTLGPAHVPTRQLDELKLYLAALVASRTTPVHVNTAFNACYFGYDLRSGYAGTSLDPDSFPTVALGQTLTALPVGALINVATGGDPIWAEVVYKEGAHPELGDDGSVPSWLSGAPSGATGPATADVVGQPTLRERLVLDMDVFGLAPTPAQMTRLTRRGRWLDDDGHLLVDSQYDSPELAELGDAAYYQQYLLTTGRALLFSTTAPAPLPLLLTYDAGPEQHQAALAGLFATISSALHELENARIWHSYAVARSALAARLRNNDSALSLGDLDSLVNSTARSAVPDHRRRVAAARRITYTALGPRLRCVDGSRDQLHGAGYANAVLHANLVFSDYVRGESEDGLLFDRVHLRLDDAWQGGGIWRAEAPGSSHALLDPAQALGLGWRETLTPALPTPAPPPADEPEPEPEPEPETPEDEDTYVDDLDVSDSQITWTVPLRGAHIDAGVLTLPEPAAHALRTDGRDGTRLRLLLTHDGYELDVTEAVQLADAALHDQPARIVSVTWPMEYFPGILLTVTWPRNTATLRVSSTLLPMPVTIDDELEIEHCYDPRIVTRDNTGRSGDGSNTLRQRIMQAIRRLGLIDLDGIARLDRTRLSEHVYGSASEQHDQALAPTVDQLLHQGVLTLQSSSSRGGLLTYPAEPGQPSVELLCYTPEVVTGPPRPRRFTPLESRYVSTHAVSGFLRRIDHLGQSATAHARAAYREYRSRHGLAGPAELPDGWTFVRPHQRGA